MISLYAQFILDDRDATGWRSGDGTSGEDVAARANAIAGAARPFYRTGGEHVRRVAIVKIGGDVAPTFEVIHIEERS